MKLLNMKEFATSFHVFCEDYLIKEIREVLSGSKDYLTIDLDELLSYNPEIVESLLADPIEIHKIMIQVLKEYNSHQFNPTWYIKFLNVSKYSNINLSFIRSQDLNKLVSIQGMLKRKSTNMVKVVEIDYLCINPSCPYSENTIKIFQNDDIKRQIKSCPKCKSPVEVINEVKIDYQQLYVEELSEDLDNSGMLPEAKLIEIYGKLTQPDFINQFLVGSKIEVVGIIKEKKKQTMKGESTLSTTYIDALNITSLENDITSIEITADDEKRFKQLSKNPNILTILRDSLAPNIAGRQKIKEGTLLYIVGGSKRDKHKDLIHILTIGNASLAKSVMLRQLKDLLPRTVYVSAENSSAVGLVGAAVNDKLTGSWTLEAGAMPLANNGYFLLDEFDKIKKEDGTKLNEALEHQEVHINKAGIRGVLKAYTPCYAAANPKHGKFDENQDYSKQITFDKTLLSRFDLIYILDGKDNDKENESIIDLMLGIESEQKTILELEDLRKYLIFSKTFNPVIPNELKSLLKNYFLKIQSKSKEHNTLDITYRQLTALERMSEAYAKLRLSNEVIKEDVSNAITLMNFTLNKFSLAEIEIGLTNKTYKGLKLIEKIIEDLSKENQVLTYSRIKEKLTETDTTIGLIQLNKYLDELKQIGFIFEPRKNEYRLI